MYLIISLALLSYGISSTFIVVLRTRIQQMPADVFLSLNLILFVAFAILSLGGLRYINAVPAIVAPTWFNLIISATSLLVAYFLFLLPFFSCGNIVVYLFSAYPNFSNRLYFWDLAGAAIGCLAFAPLVIHCGVVVGVLVILFLSSLLCVVIMQKTDNKNTLAWRITYSLSLCAMVASLSFLYFHDGIFRFTPDRTKSLGVALNRDINPGVNHEYSSWDVVSRIDIVSNQERRLNIGWSTFPPLLKVITFDGDAISRMAPHSSDYPTIENIKDFKERDVHVPFFGESGGGNHLIIGLGGGLDIERSLLMQAENITGVDINSALIKAMKYDYAEFSGNIFNRPHVSIYHSEGRSFLKRSRLKFDLIQMTGVDTYTALNTGAYVLAENYLYTVEALRDYYNHLSNGGILCVERWFFDNKPRECLRLFAIALEALKEENVSYPEQHVAVIRAGLGIIFVRKTPFTRGEVESIEKSIENRIRVAEMDRSPIPSSAIIYLPWLKPSSHPASRYYHELVSALRVGKADAFYRTYDFDIAPVTDDQPFFFNYYRVSAFLTAPFKALRSAMFASANPGLLQGYWPYLVFLIILFSASIAVGLFIFIPLLIFKREGMKIRGSIFVSLYFFALGLGFIMIEIVFMQKFALFLGHPIYSISTVLGGMLFFAGLGSNLCEKWKGNPLPALLGAVIIMAVMIIFFLALSPSIVNALLGQHLMIRILVTILMVVAPLSVVLGFFFPLGLKIVSDRSSEFIPWAWAINSGFTVIGSILSIILAMALGFNSVLLIAAGIYALGFFSMWRYIKIS